MDDKEQLRVEERGADVRTFLIAEVRGYTRFTQEHGDEAAGVLAAKFAKIPDAAVTDLGGQLELRGDEALAVFTSARGALLAAVELQARLRTPTESGPPLALGVGIGGLDSGKAVPIEGGYRGGALNLAARLCAYRRTGPDPRERDRRKPRPPCRRPALRDSARGSSQGTRRARAHGRDSARETAATAAASPL
ncbi:MAG TPA: hypothetical protein VFF07_12895 [Actinomycetota bacterium]|nr:hypothetical protein [Actinomycetota bacterium]